MPARLRPVSPRPLVYERHTPTAELKGCRQRRSLPGWLTREPSSEVPSMPHVPPLVSTLAIGLVLAFSLGVLANRFKLPPLVGYLLAGIALGPFTPGYVADLNIANQLAEVGVILLMFGVGLHFSLEDLLSVRGIAVPGALAQGLVATPLGVGLGWWLGWGTGAGLLFGLALSVASTVVLLRLLQERRLIETERGKITVGWLIVQDIAMVLVLVLLPGLAGLYKGLEAAPDLATIAGEIGIMLGKFAIFVAVMLIVGKKLIPGLLHYVAHTGSRELFRLAVLSIAAYAVARLFGLPGPTALTISASLAQIGEFSFILAGLGLSLGLLPAEGRDLILAGAIITIILNPFLFAALDVLLTRREKAVADRPPIESVEGEVTPTREPIRLTSLTNHVVLIG